MNAKVISAIFRRNFVSYLNNPTGYVFICFFVFLSSMAAFWPHEFFSANLANLNQLNIWLPYVMLGFIPAITMSIWADERRQGTDELLLTIPATDFDVVLGKYLAAVAIFSVALVFSLVSNLLVLLWLGSPDLGLFLVTYIGYWLVGGAMISIGMAASFFTSNLTVGFVLGLIFNLPLVLAEWADVIAGSSGVALAIRRSSIAENFRDFGRGVISLSGAAYFLLIVAVMLYLSMILIGRRHWLGGRDGQSLGGHYLARAVALVAIAAGIVSISRAHDYRLDLTDERISSLSPDTRRLIRELDATRPVRIDAYISNTIPESLVQTQANLLSMLREMERMGAGNVEVRVNRVEPLDEAAQRAEQQYDITSQRITVKERGAFREERVFMGAAFTCGLEQVVVKFFDRGTPVEYELVRSICTVVQPKRKKLGVLTTDAQLFGGLDMQTFSQRPPQQIVEELKKQYDVVQVDPNNPITERYDVLLAVQPSSLSQPQMNHFVSAVAAGQPTAIFEDPLPVMMNTVPGTSQPKQPRQNMMMMGGRPPVEAKGDITALWRLLGVELVSGTSPRNPFGGAAEALVVWQAYNPYPKSQGLGELTPEWVFVDNQARSVKQPFEAFEQGDPITSRLHQILLPFPGALRPLNVAATKRTTLVKTGDATGTITTEDFMSARVRPESFESELKSKRQETNDNYDLVVRVQGKPAVQPLMQAETGAIDPVDPAADKADSKPPVAEGAASEADKSDAAAIDAKSEPAPAPAASDVKSKPESSLKKEAPKSTEMDVVVVADIDMLHSAFFGVRDQPNEELGFDFDNIAFVLNVVDVLAGDTRFVEIRKRKPVHRTLSKIDDSINLARELTEASRKKFIALFEEESKAAERAKEEALKDLQEKSKKLQAQEEIDPNEVKAALVNLAIRQQVEERRLETKAEQLKRERDRSVQQTEQELTATIRSKQGTAKLWAALLSPIPPLLVALAVFFNRRAKEHEGVARSRLR